MLPDSVHVALINKHLDDAAAGDSNKESSCIYCKMVPGCGCDRAYCTPHVSERS